MRFHSTASASALMLAWGSSLGRARSTSRDSADGTGRWAEHRIGAGRDGV